MLHEYQEKCIEHIKCNPFAGLFLDMGLGKTLITLTALSDMYMTGEITGKTLIIAPLAVCKKVWTEEIRKWGVDLTYSLVIGDVRDRLAALGRDADLYIINRENTEWLVKDSGISWQWETVVIDEISSFKNNRTKRFKALRHVRPFIKRLIGLTGTPAPNSLIDLWSQMYLLDTGARLEKHIGRYRVKYFYPLQTNGNVVYKYGLRDGAEDQIHEKISDICISMRSKDYLNLPQRTDNIISVQLSEKDMAAYKEVERSAVMALGGEEVTAANAAVLAGKLLQVANGAVYTDGGKWQEVHTAKIDALAGIVEEAQGQPIIVYYQYKHDLARLMAAFPGAEVFDGAGGLLDKWNAGGVSILLVHPQSAGHGINLQYGGHIGVWFGLTWSLENYLQANARIDRQGQTSPVIIHHLIAAGTIDERVLKVLQGKETLQDALMEAVKYVQG